MTVFVVGAVAYVLGFCTPVVIIVQRNVRGDHVDRIGKLR